MQGSSRSRWSLRLPLRATELPFWDEPGVACDWRLIPVILSPRRLTLPARRGSQVAEAAAHTGALCHAVRVEVPPVRIDAPADRRMAGHAILLLMTGRATLHALPRGAPVLQEPLRLRRVKGHVQPAARRQPAGLVTITAEGLGIVTR